MDAWEQTRGLDRRIAGLAERQHGVVARRQLEAMGIGREAIEVRLRSGRLHRLHRGVYAVGHRRLSMEARWIAAVLASGLGAVLSHATAAALWGIRSLPRTIFDLAADDTIDQIESLIREAEYRQLHDRLSLPHLLERYPRRRGAPCVRAALERIEGLPAGSPRGPLEERFLPFLRRYGLPRPRLNDWILVDGRRFQVDCHWLGSGQVVELDGWAAHGTRSAFRTDRARDRALRVAGYAVTRISWAQLEDEPEAIAADLRKLLAQYRRT